MPSAVVDNVNQSISFILFDTPKLWKCAFSVTSNNNCPFHEEDVHFTKWFHYRNFFATWTKIYPFHEVAPTLRHLVKLYDTTAHV